MNKTPEGISILNKLQITTKEIITYLETVNGMNDQILMVLKKEPCLPGYEKLPWVIESKVDKKITKKLKNKKALNSAETLRLKIMLTLALDVLRKGQRYEAANKRTKGLQNYIEKLG